VLGGAVGGVVSLRLFARYLIGQRVLDAGPRVAQSSGHRARSTSSSDDPWV